uniref:WD repeat domain 25 n=1 Tax=Knipowitschia caucasica TaxID=637954 RepID=A0AAV2JEJ6_KNICA
MQDDSTMSSLVAYEDSDSDCDDEIKTCHAETCPSSTWKSKSPVVEMYSSVPSSSHVQPYVLKRQRCAPVESSEPSDASEHIHREERPILSDGAHTVKQCLSQKLPVLSAAPKRLHMRLGGHQGPVNTVKWCPVPHLSHLLLSASMDKTFKVWDGVESGRCLSIYKSHSEAVRAACWSTHGRHILTGAFDNSAQVTDVETARPVVKLDAQFRVTCVAVHPSQPEVVLCGGYGPALKAWDTRSAKVVREYKAAVQQALDVLFLRGGQELVSSSDCVSRDSADRTLIAWDYATTARLSNQIYQERYTCPSLALHPVEDSFVAQTNGNYMALFSCQRPYRMNKRRRYEGHKVEGFAVQCAFSADGALLASGSAGGSAYFFDFHSGQTVHVLRAHGQACVSVAPHPVLPSTTATCSWDGEIKPCYHRLSSPLLCSSLLSSVPLSSPLLCSSLLSSVPLSSPLLFYASVSSPLLCSSLLSSVPLSSPLLCSSLLSSPLFLSPLLCSSLLSSPLLCFCLLISSPLFLSPLLSSVPLSSPLLCSSLLSSVPLSSPLLFYASVSSSPLLCSSLLSDAPVSSLLLFSPLFFAAAPLLCASPFLFTPLFCPSHLSLLFSAPLSSPLYGSCLLFYAPLISSSFLSSSQLSSCLLSSAPLSSFPLLS